MTQSPFREEEITMKILSRSITGLLVIGLTVFGCSQQMSGQRDAGWNTLLDGSNPKTLDNWNRVGDANWRVEEGTVVADKGKGGNLVSKNSYKDFQIRAEFWADHKYEQRHLHPHHRSQNHQFQERLRGEYLRPTPRAGLWHRSHCQCGEGDTYAQGRRQMEHL